jgi:hypothetical protein
MATHRCTVLPTTVPLQTSKPYWPLVQTPLCELYVVKLRCTGLLGMATQKTSKFCWTLVQTLWRGMRLATHRSIAFLHNFYPNYWLWL